MFAEVVAVWELAVAVKFTVKLPETLQAGVHENAPLVRSRVAPVGRFEDE